MNNSHQVRSVVSPLALTMVLAAYLCINGWHANETASSAFAEECRLLAVAAASSSHHHCSEDS